MQTGRTRPTAFAEGEPMPDFDDLKRMADEHDEQIDGALEKVGNAAGHRFGHEEQIDKAVDALQERTGDGDSTTEK